MSLRLLKIIDEHQLLTCVDNAVWGSKKNRLRKWEVGDQVVFIIGKFIVAFGEVNGPPFISNEIIWGDDLYEYRIPIKFVKYFLEPNRIPFPGNLKLGKAYGLNMLTQTPISKNMSGQILRKIFSKKNDLKHISDNIDNLLDNTKLNRPEGLNKLKN
jgi:hypothetical protein